MRYAKALGLAFVAMLALNAVAATAASADDFTAEKYPATLTGTNDPGFQNEFSSTVGTFRCTETKYMATIAGATTSLTASPSFSGCAAFGFPFVIDMNGCTLKFNVGAGTTGDVDLVCPAGAEVTMTANSAGTTKCTVHIPSQSFASGVTYSNTGAGATREVNISGNISNALMYKHTAGTGIGVCTTGSGSGSYAGSGLITGETGGGVHVGIFLS